MGLKIACLGDSLTAGQMRRNSTPVPMSYQYWFQKKWKRFDSGLPALEFQNLGQPGALMNRIFTQLSSVQTADIFILMGGTNDFWNFSSSTDSTQNQECREDVLQLTKSLISQIYNEFPKAILIVCSVPPINPSAGLNSMQINIVEYNKMLRNAVDEKKSSFQKLNIEYCDLFISMAQNDFPYSALVGMTKEDGIHFTELGNATCGEVIASVAYKSVKNKNSGNHQNLEKL